MNALRMMAGMIGAFVLSNALAAEIIEGEWVTQGYSAKVQIARCAEAPEKLCGKIDWLWEAIDENGKARVDRNNPNSARRSDPVVGLSILRNFLGGEKSRWSDGTIYDPESGRTYKSSLTLRDATTLEVNGCVLFVCKTQIWRKAESVCPVAKRESEVAR